MFLPVMFFVISTEKAILIGGIPEQASQNRFTILLFILLRIDASRKRHANQ